MSDINYDPEKVEQAASQVITLLQFASMMIPDLQMLKDTMTASNDRASFVDAAAPVIMAMGGDYESKHFETRLTAKRARALVNFIECLAETEAEREAFNKDQAARQAGLAQLKGLGLA